LVAPGVPKEVSAKLRLTEAQHNVLRHHLFPGDGLEAVALLLCGRSSGENVALTVHKIVLVPYERCKVRAVDRVTWDSAVFDEHLKEIWSQNLSIVKIHSHPTGYDKFSAVDDESDMSLSVSWSLMFGESRPHGSSVMLPDGRIFGRYFDDGRILGEFESVAVVGDSIRFWPKLDHELGESQRRNLQTFGKGTMGQLAALRVAVIGCSGTGSIVIEQLARLGVGALVLVDPDVVEEKNLNRILNATMDDVRAQTPKVHVLERMIHSLDLDQDVETFVANLDDVEAVQAVSQCDILVGCVDSAEGRNLMNRLAAFYSIPYFDVGVGLVADGLGGIANISGAIHYYSPGSTSLTERGVFSMEQVRAEEKKRKDPQGYADLLDEGYIQGIAEDRPAVIGVNMFAASLLVHEILARLNPFRNFSNASCESIRFDMCEMALLKESSHGASTYLSRFIGRGDVEPLLDRPSLTTVKA
jgi:hypothetical protein